MHLRHLDITNQNLSIWLSTYKITIPISYPKLNLKNMKGSIFVFFLRLIFLFSNFNDFTTIPDKYI